MIHSGTLRPIMKNENLLGSLPFYVGKIAEITSLTEDFRRHSPFALLGIRLNTYSPSYRIPSKSDSEG